MTLFIDTHFSDVYIVLYENGAVIKEKLVKDERQNSKVIMPTIKKILGKKIPNDILVVNGPGSFTGVRVGVTIAKGLAQNLNIPIRCISSLECLASSVEDSEKIVAFSDNNGYYVGIFDENINLIGNYEYLNNNEFIEFSKLYDVKINPNYNIKRIIDYGLSKEPINYHLVNPVYIKKIDVEK